jgi:hypothetical protein
MVRLAHLLVVLIPAALTIAAPLHIQVKRALPDPVDAETARGFLAERELSYTTFVHYRRLSL